MISVTIGNNLKRSRFNLNPNTTIREAMESTRGETGIDYTAGMLSLDGETITGSKLDQTFAELGYTGEPNHDKCFLISVVKADNA